MRPITAVLTEFPRIGPPPLGLFAAEALGAPEPAPAPADVAAERERLLAEAREEGAAEALAHAEAAFAEREATALAAHGEALAAARERWAAEEGERLAERLRAGLAAIEGAIAAKLALALAPLVEASARARAGAEVVAAVAALLAGAKGTLIEVRGPADLLAPLRDAFPEGEALVITDTAGPEVCVRAGETVIATQLGAWTAALAAAVAVTP